MFYCLYYLKWNWFLILLPYCSLLFFFNWSRFWQLWCTHLLAYFFFLRVWSYLPHLCSSYYKNNWNNPSIKEFIWFSLTFWASFFFQSTFVLCLHSFYFWFSHWIFFDPEVLNLFSKKNKCRSVLLLFSEQ